MENYSGQKDLLQKICVPNLYSYLARYHELLPASIEKPGRVRLFDRQDLPFLQFIARSMLPITEEAVGSFLRWLSRVIQKKYRTTATQIKSKPMLDTPSAIISHLRDAASERKSDSYGIAMDALRPLVEAFSVSSIMYRELRSGLIHEFEFSISNRFFREEGLYWDTVAHAMDRTRYLSIQFSAPWLIGVLDSCLNSYIARLLATRKLPPSLFFEICDLDELSLLDEDFIEEPRDIGLQFGR